MYQIQYIIKVCHLFWIVTPCKKQCSLGIVQMPVSVSSKCQQNLKCKQIMLVYVAEPQFFIFFCPINHVRINRSYLWRAMTPTFRTAGLTYSILYDVVSIDYGLILRNAFNHCPVLAVRFFTFLTFGSWYLVNFLISPISIRPSLPCNLICAKHLFVFLPSFLNQM